MKNIFIALTALLAAPAVAAEANYPDLPPAAQVEAALNNNLSVQTARTGIQLEHANQRKWDSGNYEFNLRAGTAQRNVVNSGQKLKEWDVALERPFRLFNKAQLDGSIGAESVARAEYALSDARHEAGRLLLHLWFNWQREQAQMSQWQQQVDILRQQAQMTEKRVKSGDAPKMELNQAQAAVAQASVALQQARVRAQIAASDLTRQFPGLTLPEQSMLATPQPLEHDFANWKDRVLQHNHELDMVQADNRIQQLLAQRSRADIMPDPTLGVRYASELGGNERVTGVYFSVPLSLGLRSATAEGAAYQAEISAKREAAVKRRLEGDVYNTHTQAVSNYATWQQASAAHASIRQNVELVARAYSLGESSLSDTLTARRLTLEASLAANIAQLDANEARYRLLLDAHLLWQLDANED
ncbi:MAG: TolC family protein, partial [Gallionellaceae bacterium]|nr:TolC family protein [Gallionellaceae bacterium]